jgi:hypothetical protein
VLRIRNKSFGSDFGSGSGLKSGFESGSESWIRIQVRNWLKLIFFLFENFDPASSSNKEKAAFPQLRDLATNRVRNKFAGFRSGSISKRHGSADPDPYQKVTNPQHCVQLLVNVFYYTAIVATTCKCEICIII